MQDQVQKHKLLLADDSVTIQKVVNLTFADEDIDVVSVGDGIAALDLFREGSPDIVLADVNMPGMTGYEICAKIKAGESGDRIPVVLLVGSFEPYDEEEAERVGADGYLTKPFQSISQLVDKVAELLGTSEADRMEPVGKTGANGLDSDIVDETGADSIESGATSFPSPFDSFVKREPGNRGSEPDVFEQKLLAGDLAPGHFDDIDDIEMSEAFAFEAPQTDLDNKSEVEDKIEDVSDDFLRTQPLTNSDIQEIAVDSESKHPESELGEFSEWTRVGSEFQSPDPEPEENKMFRQEDREADFKDIGDWAGPDNGLLPATKEHGQVTPDETESADEPSLGEKSFDFKSSERFEDLYGASNSVDSAPGERIESETRTDWGGGGSGFGGSGGDDSGSGDPEDDSGFDGREGDENEFGDSAEEKVEFVESVEGDAEFRGSVGKDTEFGDAGSVDAQFGDSMGEGAGFGGSEGDDAGNLTKAPEAEVPLPEGVTVLDLDEMNLLELPPVDEDEEEFEEPRKPEEPDTEEKDYNAPTFQGGFEPIRSTFVSATGLGAGGSNGPESTPSVADTVSVEEGLSRDTVEAITQRVIEVLSEKAIRDIAWEVVPDMAELIISKMAEEKLKN